MEKECTRISCLAAPDKVAYAPSLKERRMMFGNTPNFHRKSGVVQWRDLRSFSRSQGRKSNSVVLLHAGAEKKQDTMASWKLIKLFMRMSPHHWPRGQKIP
jgi:hypothetical protein